MLNPTAIDDKLNLSVPSLGDRDEAEPRKFTSVFGSLAQRRASKRSLLMAFRQLSLLVETGIDVAEAIDLVADSCKPGPLKDSLDEVFEDISQGNSLSAAIHAQEHILGHEVVASVQSGEASGRLVEVLRQTANQLEDELQMRSTISGALAYPAILSIASVAVASILVWFVLPQFEQSFESMGVEPPFMTEVLLAVAATIRENVAVLAIGLLATLLATAIAVAQPGTRLFLQKVVSWIPVLGPAICKLALGRLFVRLGHLLSNGISLLDAIQLVRNTSAPGLVDRLTETWENDVIEGKGLTQNLGEFEFLPDGAEAMLVMAEKTGKLESVLSTAGGYYRNEGSTQLKAILKLSEPLIIIVLGAFVGVVVASVLLPILDVQSAGQAGS